MNPMTSEDQRSIPEAFTAGFKSAGRLRPGITRQLLLERHELCEDLAQMLTETAQARRWELGIAEDQVLERIRRGLPQAGLELSDFESGWVMARLAELLGWNVNDQPSSTE